MELQKFQKCLNLNKNLSMSLQSLFIDSDKKLLKTIKIFKLE